MTISLNDIRQTKQKTFSDWVSEWLKGTHVHRGASFLKGDRVAVSLMSPVRSGGHVEWCDGNIFTISEGGVNIVKVKFDSFTNNQFFRKLLRKLIHWNLTASYA